MHSKWQIWDYFSSFSRNHFAELMGAEALSTFDPLCLKLVKDHLFRGAGDRVIHHKMASEVTKNWIEEEFQTLSLFGSADSYFIHQAQDLKADILELISNLDLTDRFIFLSFESENAGWKKLQKEGKVPLITVEPPRFWEINKLLDFVCTYLRLPLSYEAKNWILGSLENDLSTFYNTCSLTKLNHPDAKEISVEQVKQLFVLEKLDHFAMASLFARKKFAEFFERLIMLEGDFEKMRGFFNFMQSHLIKLADVSYINQKARPTQYDKDLQSTSKLWKAPEIVKQIEKFNRWELMSKRKDNQLWHELREAHLKIISQLTV